MYFYVALRDVLSEESTLQGGRLNSPRTDLSRIPLLKKPYVKKVKFGVGIANKIEQMNICFLGVSLLRKWLGASLDNLFHLRYAWKKFDVRIIFFLFMQIDIPISCWLRTLVLLLLCICGRKRKKGNPITTTL